MRVLCVEIKENMKDITDVIDEQGVLKSVRAFAYSDLSHPFSYVQFVNNEPPEKWKVKARLSLSWCTDWFQYLHMS